MKPTIKNPLIYFILTSNIIALILRIFSPADEGGEGKMNITEFIHNKYKNEKVTLWCIGNSNPYKSIPVKQQFYSDTNVTKIVLDKTIGASLLRRDVVNLIIIRKDFINYNKDLLAIFQLKEMQAGAPNWIEKTKYFLNYGEKDKGLLLYEVEDF